MRLPHIMNLTIEPKPIKQASCFFRWVFVFCLVMWGLRALAGLAATFTFVSDTISTSRPSSPASHTFRFTLTSSVPASGKIIITPAADVFNISSGLSYADMDFSVAGASQSLASLPGSGSGSALGVSVTAGSVGKIIFTLNNVDAWLSGSSIIIRIGTGNRQIINPTLPGSYRLNLKTQDASGTILGEADAMIAVVSAISVDGSSEAPVQEEAPAGGGGGGGGLPILPPTPPRVCSGADFNLDGKVSSIDFSILLYFWKTSPLFSNPCVDINQDKSVNSIEFSILLYQWGGAGINTTI